MPVTQARTRKQVRQSIGLALGGFDLSDGAIEHTADDTGSLVTIHDSSLLFGSDNEHRGKWVVSTVVATDSNAGLIRRVWESSPDARELRLATPLKKETNTSFTYELWRADIPPQMVNEMMNRYISNITRKGSVPTQDISIHLGGNIYNFPLPSNMIGVQTVSYRESVVSESVRPCDAAWANPQTNVTAAADSEDLREGNSSCKLTFADAFGSTGEAANDTFTALDLSGYTHIEFWMKSTLATDTNSYDLFLTSASTKEEELAVPAMSANTWTYHQVALANPQSDSAIDKIGIAAGSDPVTSTIWIDDVKAIRSGTEVWTSVHRDFWRVEKDDRRLELDPSGLPGYASGLLRLKGLRVPALMSNDSDICEVDSEYVIHSVVAEVLRATADLTGDRRNAKAIEASRREALAMSALVRSETPVPTPRWVDTAS